MMKATFRYRINCSPDLFNYTCSYYEFIDFIEYRLRNKILNLYGVDAYITELSIFNMLHLEYGWLYRLPNTIEKLDIELCNIGKLPKLPNKLKILRCVATDIVKLPDLPEGLKYLYLHNNDKLKQVPRLPTSLEKYYGQKPFDNLFKVQQMIYKKNSDKIGIWFLKCKYDPKYKYCRNRLKKEYDEIYDD